VRRLLLLVLALGGAPVTVAAQAEVSTEYRVKAAFLYNFVKFVEWPAPAASGPLTICAAGRNPFGTVLADTVRGELVNGRPLQARVILSPDAGCHVVFVARGAATSAYLNAARNRPVLTVGESDGFIEQGGIANFYIDRGNVRFEINPEAAQRADLRISARLLQLARIAGGEAEAR